MKKSGLLFCICVFLSKFNFAQSGFECREKVGVLAAHHAGMAHLPKQLAVATELSYLKRLTGDRIWQKSYRQPRVEEHTGELQ